MPDTQPLPRSPRSSERSPGGLLTAGVLVVALCLLIAVVVAKRGSAGEGGDGAAPATALPTHPNIVLILTDDQRWDELTHMPTVESQLVGKGVDFTNGFVVDPLCCPSRTTILTGKYSHSTGIYWNDPPHGGFPDFRHEEGSTIATWLHAAGYRTALVGKYLNGYQPKYVGHVPPGWDVWRAMALAGRGDGKGGYYNYVMSENGRRVRFGGAPSDYSTTVLSRFATRFITSTPASQPVFLYYAPRAPHVPATPAPRYRHACWNLPPLRPPSYNQANVSDMPAYVRGIPRMSARRSARIDALHLRHCQTLLSVDDSVKAILGALRRTGRLSDTLVVFASDNGLLLGEHRLTGKVVPYEESIRVPIVVRFDPITHFTPRVDTHLVLNLDFAETFAEAAGVSAPGAEGRSLIPLLENPDIPWRKEFLVEHWEPANPRADDSEAMHPRPPYCAVRTTTYMYVKYSTGEQELYDVQRDPYELHNLAHVPADRGLLRRLHAQMVKLCNPPPPGFTP